MPFCATAQVGACHAAVKRLRMRRTEGGRVPLIAFHVQDEQGRPLGGALIQSVPGLVHVLGYLDARRALA